MNQIILPTIKFIFLLAVLLINLFLAPQPVTAQPVQARSEIEYNEVFLGEEFNFHIHVYEFPTPDTPDVSSIKDFIVKSAGGSPCKKENVYDVRGMRNYSRHEGYVFYYRLRPTKLGQFTIPPLPVKAGTLHLLSNPQRIRVVNPRPFAGSKLTMKLSSDKAYVGQPVNLEMTWMIQTQARDFRFALPILLENDFFDAKVIEPEDAHLNRMASTRFPVNGKETIAKNRTNNPYMMKGSMTLKAVLVPKKSGTPNIDPATVSYMPYTSQKNVNGRSIGMRQSNLRHITASNLPKLQILELPGIGRPENFSGIIGKFAISSSIVRTDVKVGDPITLKVKLQGPGWLENIKIPPLHEESYITDNFKVLADRNEGSVEKDIKTFTKILRARSQDVKEIPPIRIPFFDTTQGKYIIATTNAIPLKVQPTKRITSASTGNGGKNTVAQLQKGIGHNYTELDTIENQYQGIQLWLRSPLWALLIFVPPTIWFLLLLTVKIIRKQQSDPEGRRSRQAIHNLRNQLKQDFDSQADPFGALLDELRVYLGAKLHTSAGAISAGDAIDRLENLSVESNTLSTLKAIFEQCEAARFGGNQSNIEALKTQILELANELERKMA